jgi:Polysaccharide lyase
MSININAWARVENSAITATGEPSTIEAPLTVRSDNSQASGGSSRGREARRSTAALLLLAAALSSLTAEAQQTPQPVFTELFAYDPLVPSQLLGKWLISPQLDRKLQPLRVGVVEDRIGKTVGRITVQDGDGLDGASEAMVQDPHYICDSEGSRAAAVEAEPGGVVPTERAEIQVRSDRATGAGELVKFGELVWYRFSFKIAGDWPQDVPAVGRQTCRTVIHQIKQDSFKDGKSCDASPFFKIEARPLGDRVRFFAQVAAGTPCATPPMVRRTQLCRRDLPRESWTTVQVRLKPAHDASGRVDIWLNGTFCGAYQGPMADRDYGARRNGAPFINAQPRFGIYRDRRAETQTISFDKIMFWNADPSGHPDWSVSPPAG